MLEEYQWDTSRVVYLDHIGVELELGSPTCPYASAWVHAWFHQSELPPTEKALSSPKTLTDVGLW